MGKYFITGIAGSGKSTVIRELQTLGFIAYNTDDLLEVTRFEDTAGNPAQWPGPPIDWSKYAWNWQEEGLKKLLDSGGDVFVAAVVSNQADFYSLFDKIFVLTLDESTLRHRILTRTEHDFGKHPAELAGILADRSSREAKLLALPTAIGIDSRQPVEKVISDILGHVEHNS